MTFTYNITDGEDAIAKLRLEISDTVEENASFSDEEIERIINDTSTLEEARLALLKIKKVKLADQPSSLQVGSAEIRQDIGAQVRAINSADGTLERFGAGGRSIPTRGDLAPGEAT